jgi:hypothetical protein
MFRLPYGSETQAAVPSPAPPDPPYVNNTLEKSQISSCGIVLAGGETVGHNALGSPRGGYWNEAAPRGKCAGHRRRTLLCRTTVSVEKTLPDLQFMKLTRRQFLKLNGLAAASLSLTGSFGGTGRLSGIPNQKKPNILLIVADDMGFSDLGCYGSEISTPNIDNLSANGLRGTQFYNTARCCPSRAALLTGLYPHKTGMGWMTVADLGQPGYIGELNDHCITIAQGLRPAGYRCYASGKWHVVFNSHMGPNGPKHNWPLQRGFDRYYGGLGGDGSHYKPIALTRDNTRIEAPDENYYYTDAVADNAVEFVNDHYSAQANEPFFMYVPFYAPHRPLHAKPADIAKRFENGATGGKRSWASSVERGTCRPETIPYGHGRMFPQTKSRFGICAWLRMRR